MRRPARRRSELRFRACVRSGETEGRVESAAKIGDRGGQGGAGGPKLILRQSVRSSTSIRSFTRSYISPPTRGIASTRACSYHFQIALSVFAVPTHRRLFLRSTPPHNPTTH